MFTSSLRYSALTALNSPQDKQLRNSNSGFDFCIRNQAESLNAGCFFNALLREWKSWSLELTFNSSQAPAEATACVSIPIKKQNSLLRIYIKHLSSCGRHQFITPILLVNKNSQIISELTFIEAVKLIVEEDVLWENSINNRQLFIQRVKSSVANIESSLCARKNDFDDIFSGLQNLQDSEQSLLSGHSVHPTPKSRDQFDSEDSQRFIPEYGQSFQLHWFAINSDLLETGSVHQHTFEQLSRQLVNEDPMFTRQLLTDIPEHYTLLPAHPWQAQQWLKNSYIQELISSGRLIDYGLHGSNWSATSSVRSVYAPHASFMLKYSLSVRLTNSLRHLLPKEVIRGKEIHQVKYHTPVGTELTKRYPNFEIITEPAHAAIKDADGQVMPETIIVLRENPFNNDVINNSTKLLASLTQDNPDGESRLINQVRSLAQKEKTSAYNIARKWFDKYLNNVVEPLLIAQADYGLLFGAHQQNLLISIPEGYPEKVYFRDCQGTGYSQLARTLLQDCLPEQEKESQQEHYVSEQLGNYLFTYYLLINSTFGVISALGASNIIAEKELLSALTAFLKHLRTQGLRDNSCLNYMLESRTLWSKGNFYCAYCNLNENTLQDPMAVYHTRRNPLREFSQRS